VDFSRDNGETVPQSANFEQYSRTPPAFTGAARAEEWFPLMLSFWFSTLQALYKPLILQAFFFDRVKCHEV